MDLHCPRTVLTNTSSVPVLGIPSLGGKVKVISKIGEAGLAIRGCSTSWRPLRLDEVYREGLTRLVAGGRTKSCETATKMQDHNIRVQVARYIYVPFK